MMKVLGDSVIDTDPLIQYWNTSYNLIRFVLDVTKGDNVWMNIDPITLG